MMWSGNETERKTDEENVVKREKVEQQREESHLEWVGGLWREWEKLEKGKEMETETKKVRESDIRMSKIEW